MKKSVFITIGLFLMTILSFNANAQTDQVKLQPPTTEEEYNYLTKGYKIQVESGLDMKKGYNLIDLSPSNGLGLYFTENGKKVTRTIHFKGLVRDGEKKACAILCIFERKDTGYRRYACIPSANAPDIMWSKYLELMNDIQGTPEWRQVIAMAFGKLSAIMSGALELQ